MTDVTRLLNQIEEGDPVAADELLPLVYEQLHGLAAHRLVGERAADTLQVTDLVHEAYLRMVAGDAHRCWHNRRHFMAAAGQAMRRILVDRARKRLTQKRGGHMHRVDFDANEPATDRDDTNIVALDEALTRLAEKHAKKAQLVQLHYFGGLTLDEAAAALGFSPATADRYWKYARAWLAREMRRGIPASDI